MSIRTIYMKVALPLEYNTMSRSYPGVIVQAIR